VYTACSSRLTSGELEYILNDCQAKVFITTKYKADQAAEIVAMNPAHPLAAAAHRAAEAHPEHRQHPAQRWPRVLGPAWADGNKKAG
jgi:acyl-CoA synthetase (AMP-forming)/AMP-acid ligase II